MWKYCGKLYRTTNIFYHTFVVIANIYEVL